MNNTLIRRGLLLEYITLAWNVVGCVVVFVAATTAHSVALMGFGVDSAIEIFASVVVVWQLKAINKDKEAFAEKLIGTAFLLLALYIVVQSGMVLVQKFHPGTSLLGIAWLALTAATMFVLAFGKHKVGNALNNPVLKKEAKVTVIDGLLAVAMLCGVACNYFFGIWWADPIASFVIVYYGIQEGLHALRG